MRRLPAELRNNIYEYALYGGKRITVIPALTAPSLTATCRKIRYESKLLWYTFNTFHFHIFDCDATLLSKFTTYTLDLGVSVPATVFL